MNYETLQKATHGTKSTTEWVQISQGPNKPASNMTTYRQMTKPNLILLNMLFTLYLNNLQWVYTYGVQVTQDEDLIMMIWSTRTACWYFVILFPLQQRRKMDFFFAYNSLKPRKIKESNDF